MTEIPPTIRRDDRARCWVLEARCTVPGPVDEVFAFFADAANLERLTPPMLRFRIVTPSPIEMREGALIDYHLRVRGVPIRWRTRIAVWEPGRRFIDEQLRGPYHLWRHEHRFAPIEHHGRPAVDMHDTVRFRPRLGPLGAAAVPLLVAPDLRRIFTYRRDEIRRIFAPDSDHGRRNATQVMPPAPTLTGTSTV